MHFSRSHHAVIRVYYEPGNVIETHEHKAISNRREVSWPKTLKIIPAFGPTKITPTSLAPIGRQPCGFEQFKKPRLLAQ